MSKTLSNPKTIIAICSTTGPQSGKSTYLRTVLKRYPDAVHLRFSDPLISFLCEGLKCLHGGNLDYETLKKTELLPASGEKRAVTGRDFMIAAGDALRKALRPSFYADILMERLGKVEANTVVLDDLRKIPEINALVNSGHKVLVINVLNPKRFGLRTVNDCEFQRESLKELAGGICPDVRYMEVTWDERGSFKRIGKRPTIKGYSYE